MSLLAALARLDHEASIKRFRTFVERAWEHVGLPDKRFVPGRHIDVLCNRLQAAAEGKTRSLLVNLPPRHSKSVLLVLWQAWIWAGHERCGRLLWGPSVQIMRLSYDQSLVRRDSDRCRRLVRTPWYRDLSEGRVEIRHDRANIDEWELTGGGGLTSLSLHGGLTGKDSDVQILDDPHNVMTVESAAERRDALIAFREALPSRANDPHRLIRVVAAQRTHVDDLSADILAGPSAGEWEHLCLPAHYDPEHPYLSPLDWRTEPGEVLWPERFDETGLRVISADMTQHARLSQLEQTPQARGAGVFRNAKWQFADEAPVDIVRARYWDKAATAEGSGGDPDFTAGALGGFDRDGRFWLLDIQHGRWSSHQVEQRIHMVAREIDPAGTQIWIEEEPGAAGKDVISYYQRNILRGFPVRGDRPTGPKLVRIDPFLAAAEAGNVVLLRASWNRGFIDEADAFTGDDLSHDDQVIAACGAHKMAARAGGIVYRRLLGV